MTVLQHNRLRLRWYGHVLHKDDSEWVKKCMDFEVDGVRPRGRPKRSWKDVVEGYMKSLKLSKKDALVCNKWRQLIIVRVNVSDCFWYRLTQVTLVIQGLKTIVVVVV